MPGGDPSDYELIPGKGLREIINRSWNDLLGAWAAFQHQLDSLPEGDLAVAVTREKWIVPLLRELGWSSVEAQGSIALESEDGDLIGRWPITHEWDKKVPLHLLGWNVDIDTKTSGVAGAATAAPHSLVQEFLNSSRQHLWGIVSNGRRLRLLRDSTSLTRQAYLEFDLGTMFENEVFSDFIVLWLTCHRTRFDSELPDQSFIEAWQEEAHEQGVRALDELSDGVEAALEALGTGLLRHPENKRLRDALQDGHLNAHDWYRQLLRVVYRLVFLFVVEDRELLHPPGTDSDGIRRYQDHYSSARMRGQARVHGGGHHPDGWEQLTVLFERLGNDEGIPELGLPSLAGGLFNPEWTEDLASTRMANRDFYTAIRSLAFTQRQGALHRVDYRHLGSEELGSIYESLLELQPKIDLPTRTLELRPATGSERKSTGAYYTPTSLISQLLDDALDPVIEEAISGRDEATAEQALLQLTVCDPACGSAHFLVAAGHRLAKHLASIRTGDPEPAPLPVQQALRDVMGRCLFGVDMNPMAVELAKVSLWLECHVPGQPLTFLDHHIKRGNSLLGIHDKRFLEWDPNTASKDGRGGIPDDAFKQLLHDDKAGVTAARKFNKALRDIKGGQQALAFGEDPTSEALAHASSRALALREMEDQTLKDLHRKQADWKTLEDSDDLNRLRLMADSWCASFTIEKDKDSLEKRTQHPWDVFYALAREQEFPESNDGVQAVRAEHKQHHFFHWIAEFPDVMSAGGFDIMLGNPPWERVKIQEKEWFGSRAPDIAAAPNTAARQKLIRALYEAVEGSPDRELASEWDRAQRRAAEHSHFIRRSQLFPLGGVGDVNVYAAFADLFRQVIRPSGRAGFICPTGLAVGATYADFFGHLVKTQTLATFYSFENEEFIFPAVHHATKFALVVVTGVDRPVESIAFTGYVRQSSEIHDPGRRYELKPGDIEAINPNTLTAPLFRHSRDADVTAAIHRNVPVLVHDGLDTGDPWGFEYITMFHMSGDSHLFLTKEEAIGAGATPDGAAFIAPDRSKLLPLYEGKMIWLFDHRYGTYEGQTESQANQGVIPHVTTKQHSDPDFAITHRYWVPEDVVMGSLEASWDRSWMVAFRDVGPSERTMVCAALPTVASNHKTPLVIADAAPQQMAFLLASLASIPFDYAVRQKTSSAMSMFIVKQGPVPLPPTADSPCPWPTQGLLDFVVPRVVELSYTAHDLVGFADDNEMPGPPFRWEPERRALIQAELDALFFHLYGLEREDTEWVLDTFTVLRKYEEKQPEKGGFGEFRTKRLVLERYDQMAKAIADQVTYQTPLEIPPGDDVARHPDE